MKSIVGHILGFFLNSGSMDISYSQTEENFPNPVMGYTPWFQGVEQLPGTRMESRTVIPGPNLMRKLKNKEIRIFIGIQDPMTDQDAIRLTTEAPQEKFRTQLFD